MVDVEFIFQRHRHLFQNVLLVRHPACADPDVERQHADVRAEVPNVQVAHRPTSRDGLDRFHDPLGTDAARRPFQEDVDGI